MAKNINIATYVLVFSCVIIGLPVLLTEEEESVLCGSAILAATAAGVKVGLIITISSPRGGKEGCEGGGNGESEKKVRRE